MLTYIEVVEEIHSVANSESGGALLIVTANNRLCQLYFDDSGAVTVNYSGYKGLDALRKIKSVAVTSMRFHPHIHKPHQQGVIASADLLDYLNMELVECRDREREYRTEVECFVTIKEVLAEIIGPIAEFVFEEELKRNNSFEVMVKNLATNIDDGRDAAYFLEEVKRRSDARA